jgi:hypothetical protein
LRIAPEWLVIGEQSRTGEPCPEGSLDNLRNQAIALIDLSMSGDISPFETIAYPGGGSDNFITSVLATIRELAWLVVKRVLKRFALL